MATHHDSPRQVANPEYKRTRPWKARVKLEGAEYYLGYFLTREEAEDREDEFRLNLLGRDDPKVRRYTKERNRGRLGIS